MDCLSVCHLNNQHLSFDDLCDRTNKNTAIRTLEAQRGGIHYRLEYSPLGNEINDPLVILCGITPGHDSWKLYLDAIRDGTLAEKAARESIFSNMRDKMFKCLDEIGLFEYLSKLTDYWAFTESKEKSWYNIFEDKYASIECGLQLTQACNCAILRNRDSKQPSESALNEIARTEPKCLFNRFKIGPSTKLIIFWGVGRKLDSYWKKSCYYDNKPRTILLPHPSGSNFAFNHYDLFKPYDDNDSTQLRNAKASIQNGKKVILDLIKELDL